MEKPAQQPLDIEWLEFIWNHGVTNSCFINLYKNGVMREKMKNAHRNGTSQAAKTALQEIANEPLLCEWLRTIRPAIERTYPDMFGTTGKRWETWMKIAHEDGLLKYRR